MNTFVGRLTVATLLVVAQPSCSRLAPTTDSAQPPNAAKPAAAAPPGDAAAPVAIKRRLPRQDSLLERRVSVHYRRAHLGEVLYDLQERVGLVTAFPKPLDGRFTLDLIASQIRVKEVLEKLAAAGGLELEFRDDTVVFWQHADARVLQELVQTVKDKRSPRRCSALVALTQLGDKQIYPVLFWATAEASEPMAVAAARALADDHSATLQYGENLELLAQGITRLLAGRPERERTMLMGLAAATRSPAGSAPLLPLIHHEDFSTREFAISLLGETHDPAATKPLLALLKQTLPEPPVGREVQGSLRHAVIASLGGLAGEEAASALREMADTEQDQWQLLMLARALAESGDPQGVELLVKMLKVTANDKEGVPVDRAANSGGGAGSGKGLDRTLREAIVESLGATRDERAVEPLIGALGSPHTGEQLEAIEALGELRDSRGVQPLTALLTDSRLTTAAVSALEQIGDVRAAEPLAALQDHEALHVRFAVARALVSLGDRRGKAGLEALLETEDEVTRFAVVRALAAIHAPLGTDALVNQLKHPEPRQRRDAADELARLRDLSTVKPLSALLLDPDVDASFAAAWAMGNMRDLRAVEHIVVLLEDENAKRRAWGARILGWTDEAAAAPALVRSLTDSDEQVRLHAARALVQIGDPHTLDAVLGMLNDPVRDVRRFTASALGAAGEEKVIRALQAALHDPDGFVQGEAAQALLATHDPTAIRELVMQRRRAFSPPAIPRVTGYQADPCVMDCLIQLLSDDDAKVRENAATALASMEDNCAVDPLIATLHDPEAQVRETVRHLLESYIEVPKVKAALRE